MDREQILRVKVFFYLVLKTHTHTTKFMRISEDI